MIDITVDNNEVIVEGKVYHSFNNKDELVKLIDDILDKARYSEETVSLWIIRGKDEKYFVKEWA